MKVRLILVIIFFTVSSAKSQEFFLGKSKKYITDSLCKLHYFPLRIGEAVKTDSESQIVAMRPNADSDISRENAGLLQFQYQNFEYYDTKTYIVKNGDTTGYETSDTTHLSLLNFFMKNDTCFRFFKFLERKELPKTFGYLKTKYNRIDDNHWVDKSRIYEAEIVQTTDGSIMIKFKKAGSIQYILKRFSDLY
ncbi:MAG: hypothetical protein ACHQIM_19870 [Sphingobacteriales bacterium]